MMFPPSFSCSSLKKSPYNTANAPVKIDSTGNISVSTSSVIEYSLAISSIIFRHAGLEMDPAYPPQCLAESRTFFWTAD